MISYLPAWNAAEWVLVVCLVLLALILLLILYTLYLRFWAAIEIRRAHRVKVLWQPLFFACLLPTGNARIDRLPVLPSSMVPAFCRLWCSLLEMISGGAHNRIRAIGQDLQLFSRLQPLFRHRRFEYRLLAVVCLGHLGGVRASHRLQDAIATEKSPVLALAALDALMVVDQSAGLHWALVGRNQHHWPTERLVQVFSQADKEWVVAALMRAIDNGAKEDVPELLKLLAGLHMPVAATDIRALSEKYASSPEVISHLLPLVNHSVLHHWVRALLRHRHTNVRIQAARAIRRVGRSSDLKPLLPLLKDPDWWVRYRAMQAIYTLPGVTRQDIVDQVAQLDDPFAVDILNHVESEYAWQQRVRG